MGQSKVIHCPDEVLTNIQLTRIEDKYLTVLIYLYFFWQETNLEDLKSGKYSLCKKCKSEAFIHYKIAIS